MPDRLGRSAAVSLAAELRGAAGSPRAPRRAASAAHSAFLRDVIEAYWSRQAGGDR